MCDKFIGGIYKVWDIVKRAICALSGAIVLGLIAFLTGAVISQYQVRVLLYSPEQAAPFIDGFLISWPIFFMLGGWAGYHVSRSKCESN